jgi:hypothetical protein
MQVHKKFTRGELLFKLLFYCTITEKDNNLRGIQSTVEPSLFRVLNPIDSALRIAHSSVACRSLITVLVAQITGFKNMHYY